LSEGNGVLFSTRGFFPIREKLVLFFSIYTIFIFSICIYTNFYANSSVELFVQSLEQSRKINEINEKTTTVKYYTEHYLNTGSYDLLNYYLRFSVELQETADSINPGIGRSNQDVMFKNIKNMVKSYLEETSAAVNAKRVENEEKYTYHYNNSVKIAKFIEQNTKNLLAEISRNTYDDHLKVTSLVHEIKFNIAIVILTIIGFGFIFIFMFSSNITIPLEKIINSAQNIARGKFYDRKIVVDTKDELYVIADVFNTMSSSIKNLVEELTRKADIEKKLKEEETKNLMTMNLLKDAELHALQSQINPHFLFNSLNVIVQTAMMEEADKTSALIKSLSSLLRHNLRKLDAPVTLGEEIFNVKQYAYIMQARFGNKIIFKIEVDENLFSYSVPAMVMQPIIENSVIHGFNHELMNKITITVMAIKKGNYIKLSIKDTGVGMTSERLRQVIEGKEIEQASKHKGHTTGIGINNIKTRIALFYNREGLFNIYSEPMKGTEVIVYLPLDKEM
jgi:sensor histidine kinase YesM